MTNYRSDSNSNSVYTLSQLIAEYGDNSSGNISPQFLRDFVTSSLGFCQAVSTPPTLDSSVTTVSPLPGNYLYCFTVFDGVSQTNLWTVNNQSTSVQLTSGVNLGGSSTPGLFSVVGFSIQTPTVTGAGPFACSVNWNLGSKQKITLPNSPGTTTITFTAPSIVASLQLIIQQGSVATSIAWGTSLKWANGTPYTSNSNANSVDIISFLYDGATYYGAFGTSFS